MAAHDQDNELLRRALHDLANCFVVIDGSATVGAASSSGTAREDFGRIALANSMASSTARALLLLAQDTRAEARPVPLGEALAFAGSLAVNVLGTELLQESLHDQEHRPVSLDLGLFEQLVLAMTLDARNLLRANSGLAEFEARSLDGDRVALTLRIPRGLEDSIGAQARGAIYERVAQRAGAGFKHRHAARETLFSLRLS